MRSFISLLLVYAFCCSGTSAQKLSQEDLTALFDPIFASQLEKLHIPGAAISVVQDGKLVYAKGYGVSDIQSKEAVVPDKTIFRIGSITKVFTAVAVLQM